MPPLVVRVLGDDNALFAATVDAAVAADVVTNGEADAHARKPSRCFPRPSAGVNVGLVRDDDEDPSEKVEEEEETEDDVIVASASAERDPTVLGMTNMDTLPVRS